MVVLDNLLRVSHMRHRMVDMGGWLMRVTVVVNNATSLWLIRSGGHGWVLETKLEQSFGLKTNHRLLVVLWVLVGSIDLNVTGASHSLVLIHLGDMLGMRSRITWLDNVLASVRHGRRRCWVLMSWSHGTLSTTRLR